MVRVILIVAFVAVLAIAFAALLGTLFAASRVVGGGGKGEDNMPETFRRISYVVLVLLLLGLASGWLGAA
ncbi:MAG: hypothetical protein AAFP85_17960 [Pseudomonadota bacterium]